MGETLAVEAHSLRQLGLRDANYLETFMEARAADAVVITKDSDFLQLLEENGPPPRDVWVNIGNTSNANLRAVLSKNWPRIETHFRTGEHLVEIQS